MKFNIKKLSILGLAGVFIVSAMLCCCFTNQVEAKEPVPSCHQTAQDSDSSNKTEECECDQSFATLKEYTQTKDALQQIATISLDQLHSRNFYISSEVDAYQAPPLIYDTSPLYIKHSILRV